MGKQMLKPQKVVDGVFAFICLGDVYEKIPPYNWFIGPIIH